PETPLQGRADGALLADGRPVRAPYVLANRRVPLAGAVIAEDEGTGMVLRRLHAPLWIAYAVTGLYPDDTWSGKQVTYTRRQCRGGRLTVDLVGDATLVSGRQTVSAEGKSVGKSVLGGLRGMAEASAGSHELVVFGPVSIRGRPLLEQALTGLPAERHLLTVPFAHATRRVWSRLGRPSAERFVGGFDVL